MATPRNDFIYGALRLVFCDPWVFAGSVTPTTTANTFKAYVDGLEEQGFLEPGGSLPVPTYEQTLFNALMYATQTLVPMLNPIAAKAQATTIMNRCKAILDQFVILGLVAPPVV